MSLALCVCCGAALAVKKPRMGVVAIQDRGNHSLGTSALESRLSGLVKAAGYEPVPLRFQPAADVEHQARQAGCGYILYTDVVEVRRTTGTQLANTMTRSRKRDVWEAEVEFRVFAMDQVQPLLATSVTGRNAKRHPAKPAAATAAAAPAVAANPTLSVSESNILMEATPLEETGRQRKHKSVAVASALEREVKLVRERLSQPIATAAIP